MIFILEVTGLTMQFGGIRALDGKANTALIGKIIQAHQNFDPADLPSGIWNTPAQKMT